jgi:hypothetical protein
MALHPLWILATFSVSQCIYSLEVSLDGESAHRKAATYIQNKRIQTSMPRAGFELTIPVFEQVKKVHALDRESTVIGL